LALTSVAKAEVKIDIKIYTVTTLH